MKNTLSKQMAFQLTAKMGSHRWLPEQEAMGSDVCFRNAGVRAKGGVKEAGWGKEHGRPDPMRD